MHERQLYLSTPLHPTSYETCVHLMSARARHLQIYPTSPRRRASLRVPLPVFQSSSYGPEPDCARLCFSVALRRQGRGAHSRRCGAVFQCLPRLYGLTAVPACTTGSDSLVVCSAPGGFSHQLRADAALELWVSLSYYCLMWTEGPFSFIEVGW